MGMCRQQISLRSGIILQVSYTQQCYNVFSFVLMTCFVIYNPTFRSSSPNHTTTMYAVHITNQGVCCTGEFQNWFVFQLTY